jgi:pyruvate carboxylase
VSTNIPFLQAVLDDSDFQAGHITTSFIDERPQLLTARSSADRGTKILTYLADVTVNKPHGSRPSTVYPHDKLPDVDLEIAPPPGSKQRLAELGPERFARWLKESPAVGVTDTTFRDAHQSLLATRVRTSDLMKIAPYIARTMPQLLSVECWGGATYDVALRFLKEDPWERLAALREAMPNICLQMLLRGRNTVGYTPYPEVVASGFVEEATATGIDVFRIFDALNNVESMRPAIDAVRETGSAIAEVAPLHAGLLPQTR